MRRNSLSFLLQSSVVYFEKHYHENMDYNSCEAVKVKGCIFTRQAGSRKTTLSCEMVKKTEKPLILAFSNKAIINMNERLKIVKTKASENKSGLF